MIQWLKESEDRQKKDHQLQMATQQSTHESEADRMTEKLEGKEEAIAELQQRILELQRDVTDKTTVIDQMEEAET